MSDEQRVTITISGKQGAGKSIVARLMASVLHRNGSDVALFDGDRDGGGDIFNRDDDATEVLKYINGIKITINVRQS